MRDVDYPNDHSVVENLVDQPEFAPPRGIRARQLASKWLADAMGAVGEWTADELPTSDGYRFGQQVGQRPLGCFRQLDAIRHRGSRPAARISSVTSSSV